MLLLPSEIVRFEQMLQQKIEMPFLILHLKLLAKDFQGVGRIAELNFVVDEVVSVENLEFAPEQA